MLQDPYFPRLLLYSSKTNCEAAVDAHPFSLLFSYLHSVRLGPFLFSCCRCYYQMTVFNLKVSFCVQTIFSNNI